MSDTPRTDAVAEQCVGQGSPMSYVRAIDLCRDLERELTKAHTAISEHNAECVRMCDDRKHCGYEKYAPHMGCSTCPKDWMIDYPSSGKSTFI